MDARCAIGLSGATMDRLDLRGQREVLQRSLRRRSIPPGIKPAGRDTQQPAHRPDRIGGLIRFHEPEERREFGTVSCANQAAAFDNISRLSFSWRFSVRNRASSSRSPLVRPSLRLPASRPAWATQLLIDCADGSSSRDSSAGDRPTRRNAGMPGLRSRLFSLSI